MARKPAPTILQEELYPPHGAQRRDFVPAREEMHVDDTRLVDLDVDEESPFLRAQKRVSARRSSIPRKTANRLLWTLAAAAGLCILTLGAAVLYYYGERSWRFRVESSDNIEVVGMQNVTKAQVMEVMGADIGRNIFFIPLAQQKAQLEQIPWVESASVMRFVPDRVRVEIHERTPVAFARIGPRMFLIDAGGTLMDLSPKHKYSFPVILGMNAGEPLSTRAPRMQVYSELVHELDGGGAHYSQDLSEVDLSDLEDVKVRVNDPQGDVLVRLGSSDYLTRYKIYVSHAQGWRQQFQKLESVDLRYDNQIIVNPDPGPPSKQTALTSQAAKVAAAAGVKTAALVTRAAPREWRIPKPAFELTQKKLDAAGAETATKKPAVKAKPAKVVPTTAKVEGSKKPASGKAGKSRRAAGHIAAQSAVSGKRVAAHTSKTAKAPAHTAGTKPSPAIAKTQNNAQPSDE
jgi:cell division protein FtsQ